VIGRASGQQAGASIPSSVAASDINDRLQFVAESYDRRKTRLIDDIDEFRQGCLKYKANMYKSLYAPDDDDL